MILQQSVEEIALVFLLIVLQENVLLIVQVLKDYTLILQHQLVYQFVLLDGMVKHKLGHVKAHVQVSMLDIYSKFLDNACLNALHLILHM